MPESEETLVGEDTEPSARADPPLIERGADIGRYVVLDRIGAGAMGVVFAAYDPELDRRVAIKVLRPRVGAAGQTDRTRLQREAQALAKLSHRNVVTVFDVGLHEGDVYVAMEFVDGQTLTSWAESEPSWREVVEVYIQAGRGLAAAHEVGLVHRDFKPDNVMIDQEGRVRVMDFGLARGLEDEEGDAVVQVIDDLRATPGRDALGTPLTRTGAVMGTPAYMSPEQFAGTSSGPASDQFSFSVALYEALYGERPFAGDTMAALSLAVARGIVREPRRGSDVPRWVRAIVVRGLQPEASARWANVRAMVDRLGNDPALRRNRRLVLGAIVGLVALSLAGLWRIGTGGSEDCDAAAGRMDESWNEARRASVVSAIQAVLPTGARDVSAEVIVELDDYASTWRTKRRELCEAPSAADGDTRDCALAVACLDCRRAAFGATVEVLEDADATVAERADKLVEQLYGLDACLDFERLRREPALPGDKETLSRLVALEARLESVRALHAAQRTAEAASAFEELMVDAERLGYAPFLARTTRVQYSLEFSLGKTQEAHETARRGYELAVVEGMHDVAAHLASSMTFVLSRREETKGAARAWADSAMAHAKASDDIEVEAAVLNRISGTKPEAEEMSHRELVLARHEEAYGVDANELVHPLFNLGFLHLEREQPDRAEARFNRALAILEAEHGKGHVRTAPALNNLSEVAQFRGDTENQERLLRQALEISEAHYGPASHRLCIYFANLGDLVAKRGNFEEAMELNARCVDATVKTHEPSYHRLLDARLRVGQNARRLGKRERATVEFEAILDGESRLRTSSTGFALEVRAGLAALWVEAGRIDEGLALLEAARKDAKDASDAIQAHIDSQRARVLWHLPASQGGDRAEAVRLMTEAHSRTIEHDGDPAQALEMQAWLDDHPVDATAMGQ